MSILDLRDDCEHLCAWFRSILLTPAGLDSSWASRSHYQWCPSKAHVDLYPMYTVKKNQMIDTSLLFLINGLNVYLSYFYCHLKGFFFKKSYLQFKNLPLEFFDVCALDHVSLTLPLRNPAPLPDQFKQHIHRLIGYLQVLMVLK